jgi:hypothetical protein
MKSRYDVIPPSNQTTDTGLYYPDICRYPINQFVKKETQKQYALRQPDIDRFDLTVNTEYGVPAYDDLVLSLNNIANIHDLVPGQVLNFPDINDIQAFRRYFRQGKNAI